MMKAIIFLAVALFLFSCSGFFVENNADKSGEGVNPLYLADGSGFLSSDDFNEITPFVFRDPKTGRAFLFFSSDRDGNYDIYFAEMYLNRFFARPVKMTNLINSTSNELSPVVFLAETYLDVPPTNYIISYIRISPSGNVTNITSWKLNSSFFITNFIDNDSFPFNAKHIGLIHDETNPIIGGKLIISDGSSNGFLFSKGNFNGDLFYWGDGDRSQTNVMRLDRKNMTANGFYDQHDNAYYYIFQGTNNQLWAGSIENSGTKTNFVSIPDYASAFNDKYPFADHGSDRWSVYFASDRYGKGNFDLYRYNKKGLRDVGR